MARSIHPTAIVDPKAELAEDVEIGPYAIVEGDVTIGPYRRWGTATALGLVLALVLLGLGAGVTYAGVVVGLRVQRDIEVIEPIPRGA